MVDDNKVLRENMEDFKRSKIQTWPEVILNDRPMNGDLSNSTEILNQICNSITSPVPDECLKYRYERSKFKKHSVGLIIAILVGGIAFIILLLYGF
jgi:hypothetical protein